MFAYAITPGEVSEGQMPSGRSEIEILYSVIEIASSAHDTDRVLGAIIDLVSQAVDSDACFVYLWDPDGGALVLRAGPPAAAPHVGRVRVAIGEGIVGWAAEHRESVLLRRDVGLDPRYRPTPELTDEPPMSLLTVPIISRAGTLIGAIAVQASPPHQLTEDDQRFLEHTASLVAGGVENAQLFQLAARKEEALASLMRETIQVQEEERRRVANEIHDGVTQQLVSIWFRVHAAQRLLERGQVDQGLEEIKTTKEIIDETLAEARSAIYNLRPATLDDLGLGAALHELAARFTAETGVEVQIESPSALRLAPHLETALYRITQEGLNNVKKHAGARTVAVSLVAEGGHLALTVSDDGRGFDVDAFRDSRPQTSFGLAGMRERIELVDGQLSIGSVPGEGTTLCARVPLERIKEVVA